jgi:hypothetical protein
MLAVWIFKPTIKCWTVSRILESKVVTNPKGGPNNYTLWLASLSSYDIFIYKMLFVPADTLLYLYIFFLLIISSNMPWDDLRKKKVKMFTFDKLNTINFLSNVDVCSGHIHHVHILYTLHWLCLCNQFVILYIFYVELTPRRKIRSLRWNFKLKR